jgi:hypothetical protein
MRAATSFHDRGGEELEGGCFGARSQFAVGQRRRDRERDDCVQLFFAIVHDNLLYDEKCEPPNFALYQCSGSLLLFECNRWIEAAEDMRCADF